MDSTRTVETIDSNGEYYAVLTTGQRRRQFCQICLLMTLIFALIIAVISLFLMFYFNCNEYFYIKNTDNQTADYEIVKKIHDERYHRDLVRQINAMPGNTWKAEYNKAAGFAYTRKGLGTKDGGFDVESYPSPPRSYIEETLRDNSPIPRSFDARLRWPNCWTVHEIFDQGQCGACYAASTAASLSDRICIKSNGTDQPQISVEDIVSCYISGDGCYGGTPVLVLQKYITDGIVTGGPYGSSYGCRPYTHPSECGHPCPLNLLSPSKSCKQYCQPLYDKTYEDDLYKGSTFVTFPIDMNDTEGFYTKYPSIRDANSFLPKDKERRIEFLQREIMRNGPVVVCITTYEDSQHYKSGIYKRVAGKFLVGHAVKLIGWGEENGVKFWIIANSYGRSFGENGFMRISFDEKIDVIMYGMPR